MEELKQNETAFKYVNKAISILQFNMNNNIKYSNQIASNPRAREIRDLKFKLKDVRDRLKVLEK